jgi:hypothetical protein
MRAVVEQHQPGADGVLEVDDVQRRGILVEVVAVAAGIEALSTSVAPAKRSSAVSIVAPWRIRKIRVTDMRWKLVVFQP